jgi:hypothetical protein
MSGTDTDPEQEQQSVQALARRDTGTEEWRPSGSGELHILIQIRKGQTNGRPSDGDGETAWSAPRQIFAAGSRRRQSPASDQCSRTPDRTELGQRTDRITRLGYVGIPRRHAGVYKMRETGGNNGQVLPQALSGADCVGAGARVACRNSTGRRLCCDRDGALSWCFQPDETVAHARGPGWA